MILITVQVGYVNWVATQFYAKQKDLASCRLKVGWINLDNPGHLGHVSMG